MWIFNKVDGIIIYITGDRKEVSFSLSKDKKMFEEVIRRVRVLNNLLSENKTPILEPSQECSTCQYYERCFINQKLGRSVSLGELLGLKKD
jgi:CRISPR-associated exonuclease Cas4